MIITQADPQFRPVTIVIETQDDFDKLHAILSAVARDNVQHAPQTILAASRMLRDICAIRYPE
jgi:hypothetical protein